MYGYVYLTTNLINGKKYIGLHKSKELDTSYYGSGKLIKRALNKYGLENFKLEILETCDTHDELIAAELRHISNNDASESDDYYNIMNTAQPILFGEDNGFYGKTHSDAAKLKMSETRKELYTNRGYSQIKFICEIDGEQFYNFEHIKTAHKLTNKRIKYNFGNEHISNWIMLSEGLAEEFKLYYLKAKERLEDFYKRRSENIKGVQLSEEIRTKISASFKGKQRSIEHTNKINKNPEKIKKTAEKHRGMTRSDESKRKMSESSWIRRFGARNKDTKIYHNNELRILKEFSENDIIPDGWVLGTGKKCYNNINTGINKQLFPWEVTNEWIKGRVKCS